jgi:hypothetical protein
MTTSCWRDVFYFMGLFLSAYGIVSRRRESVMLYER